MNLVVADEFRDGNVPAVQEPLRVARRAFQSLPETVTEYYFCGDSACYDKQLNWLRNDQREGFARGTIGLPSGADASVVDGTHPAVAVLGLEADGAEAKPFAVVSNVWEWEAKRLRECHREKAGTIEAIHDMLKNELARRVAVLPVSEPMPHGGGWPC